MTFYLSHIFIFLLQISFVPVVNCEEDSQKTENGFCEKNDENCQTREKFVDVIDLPIVTLSKTDEEEGTFQLEVPYDGIEKPGDEKIVQFTDGAQLLRITRSLRPMLYEFPHFLTETEAERLIERAKANGLQASSTHKSAMSGAQRIIEFRDRNTDGKVDIDEVRLSVEDMFDVHLQPDDVRHMFKHFKLDGDGDDIITMDEVMEKIADPALVAFYFEDLRKKKFDRKGRHSEQTWLYPEMENDETVRRLTDRVAELLGLPASIMNKSDIQIVHYTEGGFYNVHIDSSPVQSDPPCCTRLANRSPCRACRFATVLVYLNDVPEGGETAFPVADEEHFDPGAAWHQLEYQSGESFRYRFKSDLHYSCYDAKLVVNPKRGKAVLWYNHLNATRADEWLGPIDFHSYHGSCPVLRGSKWVANYWIKITDDRAFDLKPTSDKQT